MSPISLDQSVTRAIANLKSPPATAASRSKPRPRMPSWLPPNIRTALFTHPAAPWIVPPQSEPTPPSSSSTYPGGTADNTDTYLGPKNDESSSVTSLSTQPAIAGAVGQCFSASATAHLTFLSTSGTRRCHAPSDTTQLPAISARSVSSSNRSARPSSYTSARLRRLDGSPVVSVLRASRPNRVDRKSV